MNVKDLKFKFAKYKITKFDLIIPGYSKPFPVDASHIGNWTLEKDYENYLYPYLEVRCIVPDKVYADIMMNSENVYVDLKVEYALFEDMYEMDPSQSLYMFGTIMENRFYAFIDNKSPKLTDEISGEKAKERMIQEEARNGVSRYAYDNMKPLVMGLYRADHIFNANQLINKVLHNATAADAVAYYFSKMNLGGVLMSPSDNPKVHDQLVLPPIPAAKGLMRVVNTYGLHKAGTTVFFDYDMIYVLNKKLGCSAWINNEIKTVYLTSFPNYGDHMVMRSGFYANGREKYCAINIPGNNISINNDAMYQDQLVGGNVLSIDSNNGTVSTIKSDIKVSKESMSHSGTVNRVVVQDEGVLTTERTKAAIEQAQNMMSITCESVNIRALSPNKDFIFTTDNTKYQRYAGHYRITSATATFTKESSMYSCLCTATFVGGKPNI